MPIGGRAVRTTCPYCGVGCGVLATPQADGSATIAGDPQHPANFGRLCSKGAALGETLSLDGRLLHPLVQGNRSSWDAALNLVALRFSQTIADHGPDSVAFYVSGQCLTEDYYVANKLMKGFVGSANIDTNSRLCMASSVAGHKRAFGSDTVPGTYEDLELADLVVLTGSNLAWCHPVLFQRLSAAKEKRGTKIVVIDPRATATTDIADLHLALTPGSDVALFNGLLAHLSAAGRLDQRYIDAHTNGFAEALASARAMTPAAVAKATGLAERDIGTFYDLFAATERTVTVYSQGVNQSCAGTDKVNAIINCHLATGRIGLPGAGPFSVTGQPNAMGGREVGGMANMLAAHMELGNGAHRDLVQTFWRAPRIAAKPGLKAVDLFKAVGDGRVKALWIMATNPLVSMPDADQVRRALEACPFVVVSDVVRRTDTTAFADILLPSLAWGEKDGTVTNSERRISRQRAFLPAPGEARADWWQLAELGKRMGWADAFSYPNAAAVFAEHAALSAVDNNGTRDFDIGAFADITTGRYDALTPFQWPARQGEQLTTSRFFANGKYFTPDRRARFVAVRHQARAPKTKPEFPFVLNTGRIREQWHTMTRTAKTARLMGHIAEPFAEIHPADATTAGLADADLVEVTSASGRIIVRVLITKRQQPGSIFVPMHWNQQFAKTANVGALIAANPDPISGQPDLKAMPVSMRRFEVSWHGFAVTRTKPASLAADYWAIAPVQQGWRIEMAGFDSPSDWRSHFQALSGADADQAAAIQSYQDAPAGRHRFAAFDGDRLLCALFVGPGPVEVSRTWAAGLLTRDFADGQERQGVLAGRGGAATPDRGAIVCSCFEVGINQITVAARTGRCSTVDAIGAATQAGTNCGSCRPEIQRILASCA